MNQKKFLSSLLALLSILAIGIPSLAQAESFTDVPAGNRNAVAIEYLSQAGIIQGYPDGTFQPNRAVSRAEFLKLVVEGSQLTANIEMPSGFNDVDESAWYGKYVRLAKARGWIEGYGGQLFKPEQTITKAEGLKIIALAQGWATKTLTNTSEAPYLDTPFRAWFTPYVRYARQKNFLEEQGDYFFPSAGFLRSKVSEVLFRSLVTKNNHSDQFTEALYEQAKTQITTQNSTNNSSLNVPSSSQTNSSNPVTTKFTPIPFQNYDANFFTGVSLNQNFPNTFYQDEVYFFDGKIAQGNYDEAFVFTKDNLTGNIVSSSVKLNGPNFSIPFHFDHVGNYKLGIVLGTSGESKVASIVVRPTLPFSTHRSQPPAASSVSINFQNDQTTFTWNRQPTTVNKLVISQGNQVHTYFFRPSKNNFSINYRDFQDFTSFEKGGVVNFHIENALSNTTQPLAIDSDWTVGPSNQFMPIEHQFKEIHDNLLSSDHLPEKMNGPGTIIFSGKALSDLFQEAEIQKPDGNVDVVQLGTSAATADYFGSKIIPAGADFTFQYQAKTNGIYIVEINHKNGSAALNIPVYVGPGVPLLPDFTDRSDLDTSAETLNIAQFQTQLLDLINAERSKAGLKKVTIDPTLNALALNYTNQMAQQDFFSHIDPTGLGPNDRRIAFKIPTDLGENLAKSPNLLYGHYGLLRSPGHRRNLLNPEWERVGLGFATSKDGSLLIAEEFSTFPLNLDQLHHLEQTFLEQLNQKRQNLNLPMVSRDSTLEAISEQWSTLMANQKFFDFKSPDGTLLGDLVQAQAPNQSVQVLILQSANEEKILEQFLEATESLDINHNVVGIGLRYDEVGTWKLTVLYSKK